MNKTNIQYLDFTWNPLAMRCTPIAAGCKNCWHLKAADRVARIPGMMFNEEMSYRGINKPYLISERLDAPLRRKKPARIGLQFMGDLGNDDIPFEWIAAIFGIAAFCQNHTMIF